jgi:hypothetical protein
MPKRISVATPQFRTSLVRKLKNLFPKYSVDFLRAERGLSFRLKDEQGRYCSEIAQLYRHVEGVLSKRSLLKLIRLTPERGGTPPARQPPSRKREVS